ncbi:MAG: adenylate/guanylate cyclase domain-containing protein [Deltaproteobacteria bacterium]|nr:adenylate/guanylate cyclase domain-containing protein [Deltaproteobacteria bacterium]
MVAFRRIQFATLLVLALVVGTVHFICFAPVSIISPQVEAFENQALDVMFRLRGPLPPPNDIVVVAMDEDSYNVLDVPLNQPLPRSVHARLLKALKEFGAKRVAFDILFLDPGADPASDEALAEAISGIPTVLGVDFGMVSDTRSLKYYLLRPLELFATKAAQLGIVGFNEDFGYVRRFFRSIPPEIGTFPTLAEAAVAGSVQDLQLPDSRAFINFYGPPGTIPTIPLYQVVDEDVPPVTVQALDRALRDKVVFVGLSLKTGLGAAQKDSFLTSFGTQQNMFGVEIHANAAGNLIAGDWIRRTTLLREVGVLGSIAFAMTIALFGLRPLWGGILWVSTVTAWAVVANIAFRNGFYVPGAFLMLILLPLTYLSSTVYYYASTRLSQRRLKKAFEFYISPHMAENLAKSGEVLRLGGEKVEATALFTDIQGFTAVSEKLQAEEVASMLNAYFTQVMDAVFENQGTLIKFIGDAVFVLWGAPIKLSDHAERACRTALIIQREVKRFNESGRFPPLHTRIGINSGPMVVGNLGSAKRFDFTAVGDSVNLASRVEGLNKYFGTSIMLTESTRSGITGNELALLPIGLISVAGKSKPVELFALFDGQLDLKVREAWSKALQCFRDRHWNEAAEILNAIKGESKLLEKAAAFYLEQIAEHRQTPPDEQWRGELVFHQK